MQRDDQDRLLQEAISSPIKNTLNAKLASLGKKAVHAVGKAVVAGIKSLLALLAPILGILIPILIAVAIVYVVIIKPVATYQELRAMQESGEYGGKALAIYLDVEEEWDEQLDMETLERYEAFKDKCIEGLNEFERNQAKQFALPYSMITSIERIDLFAWGDEMKELTGLDKWEPRPEEVYEALKTNYEWIDSKVNYEAVYTYSYTYSYNYEEYVPPVYDETGNLIAGGYYTVKTETDTGWDTVTLTIPFDVRLLLVADAFDNVYVHEYEDYKTEDIANGSKAYYISDYGTVVTRDSVEGEHDGYEGMLLSLGFSDEIISNAENTMYQIRNGFRSGAYNISFNFEFNIDDATKYYQPLKSVTPTEEPFERIINYLKERYNLNEVQEIDLRTILEIAADHDEEFAYNFAANDLGFAYFANLQRYYYGGSILGDDLAWPVPPEYGQAITSLYGPRWGRIHYGIDIGSYGGANHPIIAAADGVVAFAGWNGAYGNCVIIDHGTNERGQKVQTLYAHLARLETRAGREVVQGELIGLMGTTGRSTGVHLHFEVRVDGAKLNPLNFYRPEVYQRFR